MNLRISKPIPPFLFRVATAIILFCSTPDRSFAFAAASVEKADSLVGTSLVIKNVYRSSGGVTITKLQSEREVAAASKALQSALNKYPASFISRVLKTVYVGSEVKFAKSGEKRNWGGLYSTSDLAIFMKFDGDAKRFEQTFHHELAHGIHCAYLSRFDEQAWLAVNPPDFRYTEKVDSRPPRPELMEDGFVRPYAMFSLKEDVACLAEYLVGDTENFVKVAARYARIKRKASLLIALYRTVDPVMTERYFRMQDAADDSDKKEVGTDERGRALVVSAQAERGVFLGNFKEGDRVTLLYREKSKPSSRSEITFEPRSPVNVALCRRKKARTEPDLTLLVMLPSMTHEKSFTYTFKEDCAAVLKMEGEIAEGTERVRYEFQIDRKGE